MSLINRNRGESVEVNGKALREDRKFAGYTSADAFSQATGVSLSTIYRAETGKRIILSYLEKLAKELSQPVDRYITEELSLHRESYSIPIAGEWTGFCSEPDGKDKTQVVEEILTLHQSDTKIHGQADAKIGGVQRIEILEGCRTINTVLLGQMRDTGLSPPLDLSYFVMSITKNGTWLEGFTSWYDIDTDRVEFSKYIAVRNSDPNFEQQAKEARELVEKSVYNIDLNLAP